MCRALQHRSPWLMSSRKRSRDADEGKSRYFGVYPHGMREVALYELQHHCHATVIDEYPEVNAVIFRYEDSRELRAVGCYYTLFIYTDTRTLTGPTIKDVRQALTPMNGLDGALVEGYKSWRVTGYRLEGTDGVVHEFNTMDLEKATADCIGSDTPVDLSGNADVEVVVWVMGLRIVVGWRPKRGWDKVDASRAMSISKEGRASRAPDAVSFCVGHLALMHHHHNKGDGTMVVSDPMCGVGSYLFAMYFILVVRGSSRGLVKFYGYDADEEAIAIARANAARLGWDIKFEVLDCGEAVGAKGADGLTGGSPPIKADLVLVDPPWGHRHLTHPMVRKLYPRWSRSWLSLLKDESSLCVVVTIRTSHMQKEILPHLTYRVPNFTQVGSPVQFDNMGFGQCAAFLWALHPPT
ncbi:hypothetical protein FOZ61_006339 [Perkinsus olseni]|uniref:Ribosomal RNA large subunit methyltransferase K/L-like methyltransferase domain-containing protein n=1 Tax=Perkinsus olseni TaxID=32597 RepID=A0A7J6MA85_PEROL|nr:hypothetical protein FOZ61_006339 [Perkinsus olseni]